MGPVETRDAEGARLEEIARAIGACAQPELIVLFGSRARGTAREGSDYDLLIVVRDEVTVDETVAAARVSLRALGISADVLGRSMAQYERWQRDPGLIDYVVAREGMVLYRSEAVAPRPPRTGRIREEPPGEGLAMWLRRAESDLRIAEQSIAATEPAWDAICYHAHACAEKLLKAEVVRAGTFPPRTHDLVQLLDALPRGVEEVRGNPQVVAACELLMRLLPVSRYPELGEPTPADARDAVAAARTIREALRGEPGRGGPPAAE